MQVLAEGAAEYLTVDPDAFRAYVRDHKQRALVPKLMSEAVGPRCRSGTATCW